MSVAGSTVSTLELAQCASEPIRTPGAIQPHGWLACFAAQTQRLVAYSANWGALIGGETRPSFDASVAQAVSQALAGLPLPGVLAGQDRAVPLGTLLVGGQPLNALAHARGEQYTVELEPAVQDFGTQAPIYALALRLVPAMQQVDNVTALCQLAARKIKRLTGFGRSLVYRFDAEGHGEVLAEETDEGYDSYAQHRFPASDIPSQARELYRLNHFRLIPDATYTPVPLVRVPVDAGGIDGPLDLSLAGLRSVSPVHLEYMRNMRTLASLSVSIMVRGQLWGLISCHDHAPRHLGWQTRMACEHVGQLLSLQIEAKEDNAHVKEQALLGQLTLSMVAQLADSDATLQRLVDEPGTLLRMARASGAAVLLDDHCWTVGDTPEPEAIQRLGAWIAPRMRECFHTDRLPQDFAQWQPQAGVASGVLALSISQVHRHYVLWFRPELVQTIEWAGDPRKNLDADGTGRLHPRRSFATWREQVRGRSLPWSPAEIGAALELRQALIAIVLRRAEEMAEVAGELGRANKELEAFSYTVSHDLRAPMRHISGYVDLVLDTEGQQLSDRARRYLSHVKNASSFAGQLVDALLDFSRMGRAALKPVDVNLGLMVVDIVRELKLQYPDRHIRWHIDESLPSLWGDAILLQVAVRNLLSNAVKYTRHQPVAEIRVEALREPAGDGLRVSDNGIGFQMKYVNKLFGVFQRLHQAEEYEGTGIGLASVRRIVERHGGTVTAHGLPGTGATFTLVVPRRPALTEEQT